MAKRRESRKIRNDAERILHFEWHAAHFRSVDRFLPPIPDSANLVYGMPEKDFHAATLRFAMLRKFILEKESTRLDLVAKAMGKRVVGDEPCLIEKLKDVEENYKSLTRSSALVVLEGQALDQDDIYENIVNGLLIHSDVERRDLFAELPIGTIHGEAMRQRKLRTTVMSMLLTVEAGREQGYLDLPSAFKRVWEPEPRPQASPLATPD